MDFQTLTAELEKRALDLGTVKHPAVRYEAAINRAISLYPAVLWPMAVDASTLDTVAEQREYALAGVTGLSTPQQLLRVFIDDDDDIPREIGRWEVQDNAGTLTLVLDEEPDGAYDITLHYRTVPAALSSPTGTTEVDDDWLLARAMIGLLSEADWNAENPEQVATQIEIWTAQLTAREIQLRGQRARVPRKARTNAWRSIT